MAFLSITPETRRSLTENDRRWPFKLGMRAVATLFAFIAMILFADVTNLSKINYGGNDWVDGMPLAPVSTVRCSAIPAACTLAGRPEQPRLEALVETTQLDDTRKSLRKDTAR